MAVSSQAVATLLLLLLLLRRQCDVQITISLRGDSLGVLRLYLGPLALAVDHAGTLANILGHSCEQGGENQVCHQRFSSILLVFHNFGICFTVIIRCVQTLYVFNHCKIGNYFNFYLVYFLGYLLYWTLNQMDHAHTERRTILSN